MVAQKAVGREFGGARPDAGSGEAPASQIGLFARLAGHGRAEGPATGGGVHDGVGGMIPCPALLLWDRPLVPK
jgi:hypothetical protein